MVLQVYKELTQPTTVTHSVACQFTNKDETCLVVVRGNSLLEIYTTLSTQVEVVDPAQHAKNEDKAQEEGAMVEAGDSFIGAEMALEASKEQNASKLIFQGQWPLDGYVTGIHPVSTVGGDDGRDCLLISFKHAKMSLVKWDAAQQKIATISLHYYEKDLKDLHFSDQGFESFFRVDPQNSCACMMYHRDQLAFLPFVQKDALEEGEGNGSGDRVYQSSFLIHATKFDESLTNIIDFAFLHEYREPTMALVYQPELTWTGILPLHKDTTRFMVLSLDLSNTTSTPILSIANLPHDVFNLVPLQAPISGSMLITPNSLIHIDSSGKVTAVAVNNLAKDTTDLQMTDQSELNMRLEGCQLVQLAESNGEFLLVLNSGELCNVKFKVEGRRVYGFTVSRHNLPTSEWIPRPSCVACLGGNTRNVFVGARGGAARLLSWKRKGEKSTDDGGKVAVVEEEDVDDDMDDIYGNDESIGDASDKPIVLTVDDKMVNYGPITSMAMAKPRIPNRKFRFGDPRKRGYDVVCATGAGAAGSLSIFQQKLRPYVVSDLKLQTTESIWSLSTRAAVIESDILYDNYVVTSDAESSTLYKLENRQLKNVTSECAYHRKVTLGIGEVAKGTAVVQVTLEYAITYDSEFKHAGKMVKFESPAVQVSFQDPYVMITHETGATTFLFATKTPKTGKPTLELIKQANTVACGALTSSQLYASLLPAESSRKRKRENEDPEESFSEEKESIISACITPDGKLEIFKVTDIENKVVYDNVDMLPNVLGGEQEEKSTGAARVKFDQVLFKPIGDDISCDEYLFLLSSEKELYMYKAFVSDGKLRFAKVKNQLISAKLREEVEVGLVPLDVAGHRGVCITGSNPHMVLKSHKSPPRIHGFSSGSIVGVASFNTDAVYKGYISIDEQMVVRICSFMDDWDYTESEWPAKQVRIGSSVTQLCYHERGQVFAIATTESIPFDYVDEDGEPIEGLVDGAMKADSYQSTLKLVSALTWTVIDEKQMEPNEVIMTLKSVVLSLSEKTTRTKEVLAFGTSVLRGEDLAAKGNFYLYDAVEIVPEHNKPETDRKLKELALESVKGAVTSLCQVDGHLLVAQGQKVVVRNLQEDNSIIPVAFLDLNMYILESKNVKNFVLLGDALTSVWLAGFGQEPYRMNTMGKDLRRLQVTSCDFIVANGELYTVVADADRVLHLMQYDPEDRHSLAGQKLLPKSDFFTGRLTQTMCMIPVEQDVDDTELVPLCGSDDGVLSTIVPVPADATRSMLVVQQQIIDKNDHTACLNPRMHRDLAATGLGQVQHAMLDYNVIRRFATLDVEKKYQFSRKAGKNGQIDAWKALKEFESRFDHL